MRDQWKLPLIIAVIVVSVFTNSVIAGTLSCSVATTCSSGVVVFRIANTTNAHAELSAQSNYGQLVCCSGVAGLSNSCSGNFVTILKLSGTTNAHVQRNDQTGYANSACLAVGGSDTVSVSYQASNCTGFDTTLASISNSTNAHVGDANAYSTKICATAAAGGAQSLTFAISDNTIGFGNLSSSAARFATSDASGSTTEVEANNLTASTNATSGYNITVKGTTLTSGTFTINAIGGTNIVSSPGAEQFGLRMTASGGVGTVSSPYSAAGFAYAATSTSTSQVASASAGDGVTTTYSVRYLANITSNTESGAYNTTLTYIITGNF